MVWHDDKSRLSKNPRSGEELNLPKISTTCAAKVTVSDIQEIRQEICKKVTCFMRVRKPDDCAFERAKSTITFSRNNSSTHCLPKRF